MLARQPKMADWYFDIRIIFVFNLTYPLILTSLETLPTLRMRHLVSFINFEGKGIDLNKKKSELTVNEIFIKNSCGYNI